jgi:hypothetical protein
MTTDDTASARRETQPRRLRGVPIRFRVFTLALATAWLISLAVLLAGAGNADLTSLGALSLLFIAAENRDQLFSDETSISGSIVVAATAIVALHAEAGGLQVFLCASCAGLYWPQVRRRAWSKILVNTASVGFSGLSAALAYRALYSVALPLAVVAGVIAYWIINSLVLSAATSLLRGGRLLSTFRRLVTSETQMLGFAVVGGLCGVVFVRVGAWAGVLALLVLLAAVDVLVIHKRRPSTLFSHLVNRRTLARAGVLALVTATAWLTTAAVGPVIGALSALCAGTFLCFGAVLLALRAPLRVWDHAAAAGWAVSELPVTLIAVIGGVLAAATGIVVALVTVVVATTLLTAATTRALRHRRVEQASPEDELLLAAIDLALLEHLDVPSPR